MTTDTQEIAETLRKARQAKGLNQRELSRHAGVPQGHISKIERGTVDLRLSSLVAIARVLDLELALVPRKSVSAIQSIVRSTIDEAPDRHRRTAQNALRELRRIVEPAPGSPRKFVEDTTAIRHHAHALERLPLQPDDASTVDLATADFITLAQRGDQAQTGAALARLRLLLATLHEARMHDAARPTLSEPPRPAYSLDEDDDA